MPRKLYPGTYKNYCGPTPEVDRIGGCVAHGWHGDEALDSVDAACRLHDVSYCQCESQLLERKIARQNRELSDNDESIPMLSALTALRFATRPAMNAVVDDEYYKCINKADRQLIVRGLEIRGEQQRAGCSTDPALAWFCGKSTTDEKDTLGAFEKVSLAIFLKSLDDDRAKLSEQPSWLSQLWQQPANAAMTIAPSLPFPSRIRSTSFSSISLSALEKQRQLDLQRELASGKSLSEAAASPVVVQDEQEMIRQLEAGLLEESGNFELEVSK